MARALPPLIRTKAMASVKGAMETLLKRGGPAHIGRTALRGRTLVLAHHNIMPVALRLAGLFNN